MIVSVTASIEKPWKLINRGNTFRLTQWLRQMYKNAYILAYSNISRLRHNIFWVWFVISCIWTKSRWLGDYEWNTPSNLASKVSSFAISSPTKQQECAVRCGVRFYQVYMLSFLWKWWILISWIFIFMIEVTFIATYYYLIPNRNEEQK